MRDVAIIGVGHTKFGRASKTSLELFSEASLQAMDDAGVVGKDIEALFQGAALPGFEEGQVMPAAFSAAELNLGPIPATRYEGACASATVAIRDAAMWVSSGDCDMVLAGGVEKALTMGTAFATRTFAMSCHTPTEGPVGLTFPGVFAMAARRYSKEYDIPLDSLREKMAHVSIKNHGHGALNPMAQFYKKMGNLKVEDVVNSMMVADPLTLMDCCPFSDGAAALVLCPVEDARKYTDDPVYVLGTGQGSGSSLSKMADLTKPVSRIQSAKVAFKHARLEPKDIDILELHDCFTIAELIALECLGFFGWGEAAEATAQGETDIGGKIPTNMSGGLMGKGHPIGATGASQVYWMVKQMRGEAAKGNQIDPVPEYGMTDTLGGDFGTLCHIILGRTRK
ncbi:3-ketoacyl-CoA thiolase [ANME-1 cluster archaeon GoMg2]|nr:3-ketoacyl-CoA thiolase [ANME-1 cluster archaeon GoMg2]